MLHSEPPCPATAHPAQHRQRDLAPLPKLLRAQQRHQAQQAELAEREAREREQLRRAAATGALGADAAARVAAAGGGPPSGGGGAAVAAAAEGGLAALQCTDAKPMELPEVLSMAERQHWERTDEIIMNVLRRSGGGLGFVGGCACVCKG
jgi:hypothetical protein